MLKVRRKYNIDYNIMVANKNQKKKMPIWHHIKILDNYLLEQSSSNIPKIDLQDKKSKRPKRFLKEK